MVWLLALAACLRPGQGQPRSALEVARAEGAASSDAEAVGRWLLAELVAPGGEPKRAAEARGRLQKLPVAGLDASLARGVDADVHGAFADASRHYLMAIEALRGARRADADLLGWFVASRVGSLRGAVPGLWERARPVVEAGIRKPGRLGWRARGVLVDWWSREAYRFAADREGVVDRAAAMHGCLREARFAGPFAVGAARDTRVHFAAEAPAPWPPAFEPDPRHGTVARSLPAERHGCVLYIGRNLPRGIFYVQSFIELPEPREVILAVQGAYWLALDDHPVLVRDNADWGVWPRFGVRLRLAAGRHRVLARLASPETSIRVMSPDGSPLDVVSSAGESGLYHLGGPTRGPEPNALEPFLRQVGVKPPAEAAPPTSAVDTEHPLLRYVASYLAHVEGQDDLASVLIEPLVAELDRATPLALAQQAVFVDGDPIFQRAVARDLARDLRRRAAEGDDGLWGPRLWLALSAADQSNPTEVVKTLEALVARFPQVPLIIERLAGIYGQLGWKVEQLRTLKQAVKRFGEDLDLLNTLLVVYEEQGNLAEADKLAARIAAIDPQSEIAFRRALARLDYDAAIAELRRTAELRRDRRDIAIRVADVLARAGRSAESLQKLRLALDKDPYDGIARLALADARFAAGDRGALGDALVDAIRAGAPTAELRAALELVEGATDLEPYRRDGLKLVRETQEKGVKLPGTAARVLDYAALWVAADGSARMLEHEVIRVQSREGIAAHVEQQLPRGLVLRMRTIKSDGRVFEPELVAGKPTVTMPHLEVGDYIETEHIWLLPGDGSGGRRFRAPRWYFREPNVSYHLSELVVISPSSRPLDIETTGAVPAADVQRSQGLVVRRWTVEGSLALPEEPGAPPIEEFLPSVRMGWGVSLDEQLERLSELHDVRLPRDPRMLRIARTIVRGKVGKGAAAAVSGDERARRIYRWVLDTIQSGSERAAPRIITSKSGDRTEAFLYLCRLAGVDARMGLVRDRLVPPPAGPISAAEVFSSPAVRVAHEGGVRWLVVRHRFAPYGILPSSMRGQPAVIIDRPKPVTSPRPEPLPREQTNVAGDADGVVHEGTATVKADGSGELVLRQEFRGRYAVALRTQLSRIPDTGPSRVVDQKRRELVETAILGLQLPGATVTKLTLHNLDALDEPMRLTMTIKVPSLARTGDKGLLLTVPFVGSIAGIVRLPKRESPLYIPAADHVRIVLDVTLPAGSKVQSDLAAFDEKSDDITVTVHDRLAGKVLRIERDAQVPAGRIQPAAYPGFRKRVRAADEALNRKLRITLEGSGR